MIKIVMVGMCEGCRYADLELDCTETEFGIEGYEKSWGVTCIHRDACDFMETKTIERLKLKGEPDDVHMP